MFARTAAAELNITLIEWEGSPDAAIGSEMAKRQKKVLVLLTEEWLECLKSHAAEGSPIRLCLDAALNVRHVFSRGSRLAYSVTCSEKEARELLDLASRHCPDALPAIKDSLERFIPASTSKPGMHRN